PNGQPPAVGDKIKLKELAETLKEIQEDGADGFYKGQISDDILKDADSLSQSDLDDYEPEIKAPVEGEFAGFDVVCAAPTVTGVTIVQALQMLEKTAVDDYKDATVKYTQTVSDVFKRAYSDRAHHIGDPNYMDMPIDKLTSMDYAKELVEES